MTRMKPAEREWTPTQRRILRHIERGGRIIRRGKMFRLVYHDGSRVTDHSLATVCPLIVAGLVEVQP